MSENATPEPRRSMAPLWVIIALCAAPMIAAYVAYYIWPPSGHVNYGDILEPRPLPDVELGTLDGRRIRTRDLKGAWVLVVADRAVCEEACKRKLLYTRQVRLALGKEKDRIERVWLVPGPQAPDEVLVAEHPDLIIAHDPKGALARLLPAPRTPADHIYVIDPLGNVMLRFPQDPDPRRVLKDMSRLLRHSKWKSG